MTFTDDQIRIVPGYEARNWQSCDYYVGRTELFHERIFPVVLYGKRGLLSRLLETKTQAERETVVNTPDPVEQWLPGLGTRKEIEALATKHGGRVMEEFYPEDPTNPFYFLAFDDTDKALAFCRTPDFDALCASMGKI